MRLIRVSAEQDLTRVGAGRRRVITEVGHRAVHAGVEHAAVVHADGVGHVVDALVPSVLDHVVRGVVQSHRAVRRPLHCHDRVVMMLMEVCDVRCILLVLFARFRIVLFLFPLPFALHTDRNCDAANGDERNGNRQNGDESNLAVA